MLKPEILENFGITHVSVNRGFQFFLQDATIQALAAVCCCVYHETVISS